MEDFETAIQEEDIDFISQHIYDNPAYFSNLLENNTIWNNHEFILFISRLKYIGNIGPIYIPMQFKLKKLFKYNKAIEKELFFKIAYDPNRLYINMFTPKCMQELWEPSISLKTAIDITNFKTHEDIDKFFQKVYCLKISEFKKIPDYSFHRLGQYIYYMKYFEMATGTPIETVRAKTLSGYENKIIWNLLKFKNDNFINQIIDLPQKEQIFNIISEMAMLDLDRFEYIVDKINSDFIISGKYYINDIDRLHKFISKHPEQNHSVPKQVLKSKDPAVLSKWFKFGQCIPRWSKYLNNISIMYISIDNSTRRYRLDAQNWNIFPLLVYYKNYDINIIGQYLFSIFPNKCTEMVQDLGAIPDIRNIRERLSPKIAYLLRTLITNGARLYDPDVCTAEYIRSQIIIQTEKINFLKTVLSESMTAIF